MLRFLKKLIIILAVLFMLLVPTLTASADMGPKPSLEFEFEYEIAQSPTIEEAILFECESLECREPGEQEYSSPPFFTCTLNECSSFSYGYGEYLMLEITFSDGITRKSNIFGKEHYIANYIVSVYETQLVVEETGGIKNNPIGSIIIGGLIIIILGGLIYLGLIVSWGVLIHRANREQSVVETSRRWIIFIWVSGIILFLSTLVIATLDISFLTLPLTILIEGLLIAAYITYRKQPRLIPLTLNMVGNLLTQLILNFTISFTVLIGNQWLIVFFIEVAIVFIEAMILYLPQRRQITFQHALGLSFVLNLTSFTIGLFLPI